VGCEHASLSGSHAQANFPGQQLAVDDTSSTLPSPSVFDLQPCLPVVGDADGSIHAVAALPAPDSEVDVDSAPDAASASSPITAETGASSFADVSSIFADGEARPERGALSTTVALSTQPNMCASKLDVVSLRVSAASATGMSRNQQGTCCSTCFNRHGWYSYLHRCLCCGCLFCNVCVQHADHDRSSNATTGAIFQDLLLSQRPSWCPSCADVLDIDELA